MTLTLRAVSLNDRPLTQPITAHFDAEGGSVGRADHNTLALPDPERHISRQHAEISKRGDGYVIVNVGSANPITVRGQALGRGESAPLLNRDQIRIGGYLLEVIHDDSDDVEASTVVRHRAAVEAATPGAARRASGPPGTGFVPRSSPPGSSGGLGDLSAPLSRSNPFADLLGDPVSPPMAAPAPRSGAPEPMPSSSPRDRFEGIDDVLSDPFFNPQPAAAGVPPNSNAWAAPTPPPPRALLPDDFDPFAPPSPPPAALTARDEPHARGAFDDLIPSAAPSSIDDMFGLKGNERDSLADFMADLSPPRRASDYTRPGDPPGGGRLSTDPLALFGSPSESLRAQAVQQPADDVPELRAAFVPPAVRPSAAPQPKPPSARPVEPPSASKRGEAWSGDPQALWTAFCEGASVSIDPPQGINPELMRVIGGLLRTAVAGTLQLMTVRATAKHELRAEVTVIRSRDNNPLKFSPDARAALEQLLQPPLRGFLAGPDAMNDAMHDLVGHAIGTMAGTRAALEGVLDRFTPEQLESKLAGRSMLDSLLTNRKAKLWELYLQHFEAIRNEAQDDFHSLFGRAFLAAYEQQLDRLYDEDARKA
jgi:FHA domain-containing protein